MAFDFKKEYKEFYMPKNKPEIVNAPRIIIFIVIYFVMDYFFLGKGIRHFNFWDNIELPALTAAAIWLLFEWKPWKKEAD